MLDYVYQWIRGIAYYLVLVTVVLELAAGQSYRKYIRLFTGIILVLLIMAPVSRGLKLLGEDPLEPIESSYEEAEKEIEEKIQDMEQEALSAIQAGEDVQGDGEAQGAGQGMSREADDGQEKEGGRIEVEEIRIGR